MSGKWLRDIGEWLGGGLSRLAASALCVGAFLIIFGATPAQEFVFIIFHAPQFLSGSWGRLAVICMGLLIIGVTWHWRKISSDVTPEVPARTIPVGAAFEASSGGTISAREASLPPAFVNASPKRDWKPVAEAIRLCGETQLVAERDRTATEFDDAHEQDKRIEEKIAVWKELHPYGVQTATNEEIEDIRRLHRLADTRQSITADAYSHAIEATEKLSEDIQKKLECGSLVAKGFRLPYTGGSGEMEIPASEWRMLELNEAKSEARRRGSEEAIYAGILISRG